MWYTNSSADWVLQTESNSINYWCEYLYNKGYTNITNCNAYDQYSCVDVTGTDKEGNKVVFELKRRYINSNKYGDLVCEEHKYKKMCEEYPNNKKILVNFFKDKWGVGVLTDEDTKEDHKGAKTTEFEDQQEVDKVFHCIKKDIKYRPYADN